MFHMKRGKFIMGKKQKGHYDPLEDLFNETIQIDYLNKDKSKDKLRKHKSKIRDAKCDLSDIDRKIMRTKSSHTMDPSIVEEELRTLKSERKSAQKKIKRGKKKIKNIKREIDRYNDRFDIADYVGNIVNLDGLFRCPINNFVENKVLDQSITAIGRMLNYPHPNWRKITSIVESTIGNLSMCMFDATDYVTIPIEVLTNYILRHKQILDNINPIAIVLLNKFLILSNFGTGSIIYDCDRRGKTTKFQTYYRKYCEGTHAFDQYVDFAKFQRRYMSPEQLHIFTQYQRIIRVMEDRGMIDCKSGKLKQRVRNTIRDLGLKRDQIGQLIHYGYDKSLDAARQYYADKNKSISDAISFARDISNFSPDYAGERYAMAGF